MHRQPIRNSSPTAPKAMRVMLISEVYTPTVGGVAVFVHQLADSLVDSGCKVSVFTTSPRAIWRTRVEVDDTGATVYRAPAIPYPFNPKNDWMTLAPIFSLPRAIRRERPDCLHLHTPFAASHLVAVIMASLHRIPIVTTNHVMPENLVLSNRFLRRLGGVFARLVWASNLFLANRSGYAVAPTPTALAMMQRRGLRVPGIAITNGVDTDYYQPGKADASSLVKLGLTASTEPRLVYVGRMDGEKRVDLLIAAMPAILRQLPQAKLVLAGRGTQDAILRRQAIKLGIAEAVVFTGRISDTEKLDLLRWSDMFVIASPSELQCISGLEALACAKPLVAADQSALIELVGQQPGEQRGRLFRYPDTVSLAHAVISLYGDSSRRQLGEIGRKWVEQNHSRRITTQKYLDVYRRLIAAKEN